MLLTGLTFVLLLLLFNAKNGDSIIHDDLNYDYEQPFDNEIIDPDYYDTHRHHNASYNYNDFLPIENHDIFKYFDYEDFDLGPIEDQSFHKFTEDGFLLNPFWDFYNWTVFEGEPLPILSRRRREATRTKSKSKSKSSSSSSRRRTELTKPTPPSSKKPSTGVSKPVEAAPPKTSYPTGSYPQQPNFGYPNAGYPSGVPKPGYPNTGYPSGSPSSGYPSGVPSPGYPHAGYPSGVPKPGYPNVGYPSGAPSPGYPGGIPKPGYPSGAPSPGYPHPGYPSGVPKPGYPSGVPSSGYPHSGFPSGVPKPGYPNIGYPNVPSRFPGSIPNYGGLSTYSGQKLSKKKSAEKFIKTAVGAYATYKLTKKGAKFLSPSRMPGMGFSPFHMGHHGGKGKLGKKVIGTAIKLAIAAYALKFGIEAAKNYFEYKLDRELPEAAIQKFVSRYYDQRTRNFFRKNKRLKELQAEHKINITLGEDCNRECQFGDLRTCYFAFEVDLYQSLSRACYKCPEVPTDCERPECVVGSGRRKLIKVVNKKLGGPTIQVCEGDSVLVEVTNNLPGTDVTLHFRGQSFSGSPIMDGVPGLTQCPIVPGNSFTYSFVASEPGTHFWHAQTGLLRSEGVYGPFIVKELNANLLYQNSYDVDLSNQTIIISEEFESSGEAQFMNLYDRTQKLDVEALLVNGRGARHVQNSDMSSSSPAMFPRITFEKDRRHRVRIINGGASNCPVAFSSLGKTVTVIAIDGSPVAPQLAKNLLLSPGERYDVILDSMAKGLYWAQFKGYLDCKGITQYLVLESQDIREGHRSPSETLESETREKFEMPLHNPKLMDPTKSISDDLIVNCLHSAVHCSNNFSSLINLDSDLADQPPDATLYFSLTNRRIHNERFYSLLFYDIKSMPLEEQVPTPQINNISLKLPSRPLLADERPLKRDFCSTIGVRRQQCVEDFCECIHLQELPLKFTVDIVLINEGEGNSKEPQTLYFHGHRFWVLSQDNTLDLTVDDFQLTHDFDNETSTHLEITDPPTIITYRQDFIDRTIVAIKDAEGLLRRNIVNPLRKDSITIPRAGYAIIRFRTDNPGFWLLESSSVFKSSAGMGIVFRIGKTEDFPKIPPNLSRC